WALALHSYRPKVRIGAPRTRPTIMRVGVFGGSFDPIHSGHLFVAEAVREASRLDRVLFVPTRAGGHYREGAMGASPAERAAMIRVAIAANTAFALDVSDLAPEASGYTADLLPRLHARYPDAGLTFIVGGDSLVRSHWQRLDEVVDAVDEFVVAPRGEVTRTDLDAALADLSPERQAKVRFLDLPVVSGSATEIRRRLAEGHSVRYLVPEPVYRYIGERGLYRG
ncbi:MAG: nicotinate-nucleotide adenylyltransferase, partial [Candidatus Eremiobacteraeota bacterium]|nr:nicotinate-nucleotide adenylyltransferase [Candidatus Eremiobacteraeota bacterium]